MNLEVTTTEQKIEALPEGKTLVCAVMTGMVVHGYNSTHLTTDDLKSLTARLKAMREALERLLNEPECVYGFRGRCEVHFEKGETCPAWQAREALESEEKNENGG